MALERTKRGKHGEMVKLTCCPFCGKDFGKQAKPPNHIPDCPYRKDVLKALSSASGREGAGHRYDLKQER